MERDNDTVEKVNNTNTEFNLAFENLSIDMDVELAKKIEAINPKNKEDAANRSSNTEVFDRKKIRQWKNKGITTSFVHEQ